MSSRSLLNLDQAIEALDRPTPPAGNLMEGMESTGARVVGRLVRWWDPLIGTKAERTRMATQFNESNVREVLSGRPIAEPELRAMIRRLEQSYVELLNATKEEAQAAIENKRTYKEVPEATMEDLKKSQEALNRAMGALNALRAKLPQPPRQNTSGGPSSGQGGASSLSSPQGAPSTPIPPAPMPPTPPAMPPTPPPVPPQRRAGPPSPSPAPSPRPPAPAPAPEEPRGTEPDRTEALKEVEKALEEEQHRQAAERAEWEERNKNLRDPLRELGRKKGLNGFTPPDETGVPPPPLTKHTPSMDDRKTSPDQLGVAPPPLFIIEPPLQGYFRMAIMDRFNATTLEWSEEHTKQDYVQRGTVPNEHKIKGRIKGEIVLPLPAGYAIDVRSMRSAQPIRIQQDERGLIYLSSDTEQPFEIYFGKLNRTGDRIPPTAVHREELIQGGLSQATEAMLESVKAMPTVEKVKTIAEYVQRTIQYSNEEAYNAIYKENPGHYFQAIEAHKKADCDVANTYFIALCRRAGVPSRLVLGHRVDGSRNGKAELTYSGHGWAEVWDAEAKVWKSTDATPPGEQDQNKGEPLETGNREEGIDIKPTPPQGKNHSSRQAQNLKRALEEARQKNQAGHLSEQEAQELKERLETLKKAQEAERLQALQENVDLLSQRAEALEKEGKTKEAQALREQAQTLQGALESHKQNPEDEGAKNELRKALETAQEVLRREMIGTLAKLRLRNIMGGLANLGLGSGTGKQ